MNVNLNNKSIRIQLDTGSNISIIDEKKQETLFGFNKENRSEYLWK